MKNLKLLALLLLVLSFLPSCSKDKKDSVDSSEGFSGSGKDMIVVLDTSMSMVGQGGQNILSQVKDSLNSQVDKLIVGDSFTFATFDETTKLYPTVQIDSMAKVDVIKKYISMVEAKGFWTYTMDMLSVIVKKAEEIDAQNGDRQVVIVILTDALDDPPPALKSKMLNIKDIAKGDPKDWFIYFVSLGEAKENAKLTGITKQVADNLASNTTVIGGKDDPNAAISENLQAEIDKVDASVRNERIKKIAFVVIPLLLLALLIYLIVIIAKNAAKVRGTVEFKQVGTFRPEIKQVDLGQFKEGKVTIGRNALDTYRIMDFSDRKPVIFIAKKFSGALKVIIDEDNSTPVEFAGNKKEVFLREGDTFIAGGYQFTYFENEQKK